MLSRLLRHTLAIPEQRRCLARPTSRHLHFGVLGVANLVPDEVVVALFVLDEDGVDEGSEHGDSVKVQYPFFTLKSETAKLTARRCKSSP